MTNAEDRARDALEAQGFKAPGPKLIEVVTDMVARGEEGMPPGSRGHKFDPAELLDDTPELRDRAGAGTGPSYVLVNVLNKAYIYVFEEPDS